ncbi:MAG: hypothetical protein D3925_02505 [Candidatus Electrothrix sp. AR5]|nr:hypothetical protein [Candidatus Electrothrix sp. AR5]
MLIVMAGLQSSVIWAAEGGDITSEDAQYSEEQELREVDKFEYQSEDRPDPFLPFLTIDTGSATTGGGDEPVESGQSLKGMQLFEPGQLRLVALLKIGNNKVAMVEDVAGKGYRLDKNMLIGRHGIVHRITGEQVEITESYKTKTGRVVTKEIVMRLKKEGDK